MDSSEVKARMLAGHRWAAVAACGAALAAIVPATARADIVFDRGGDLYAANDDGSAAHRLVAAAQLGMDELGVPAIAPGGTTLLFDGATRRNEGCSHTCAYGANAVGVYALRGGHVTRLSGAPAPYPAGSVPFTSEDADPEPTADGRYVYAFERCSQYEAGGDRERAFATFERALAEHARDERPLERARTLLALGAARRRARAKRAAREALEEALAVFEDGGAALWAERTRAELHRIGGRTARPAGTLSATEAAIVELVRAGQSNREVAAALHLSVRTVEWNLSRLYARFGVRSRTQLVAALADAPGPVSAERDLPR